MNIYYHKNKWKFVLIGLAMIIGISSLIVTGTLVKELKKEERNKIKLWADATKHLVGLTGEGNYSLAIKVISENSIDFFRPITPFPLFFKEKDIILKP